MNLPDSTQFVTSNPNMTFFDKSTFEEHLLETLPRNWPALIIAMAHVDTPPVRISVSLRHHTFDDFKFTYEEI